MKDWFMNLLTWLIDRIEGKTKRAPHLPPRTPSKTTLTVGLDFKTEEMRNEFDQLSPRVQAISLLTAFFMETLWNHTPTVTDVYRTQEEQDRLYQNGLTSAKRSPHTFYRAIDIRLHDLDSKELEHIPVLVQMLNDEFPRRDSYPTAIAHGEGYNFHLHIQVPQLKKKGGKK